MILNWDDKKIIGQGGNASVFSIPDNTGKLFAVKVSKAKRNDKTYQRFKDEVEILTKLKDYAGIIPILYQHLPENPSTSSPAYFVMPLARTIVDYLRGIKPASFLSTIIKLSRVLSDIHDLNISHRDIKPDNILVFENEPVFSDFGLADFPNKKRVSKINEKIGAKWTIAPEMERISSVAEFQKADVYSFAKTLYILITKQKYSFEGQYIPNSSISLDKHIDIRRNDPRKSFDNFEYSSVVQLEQLLIESTDNEPSNRPTALEFTERLTQWYNSTYEERNILEWNHCITKIFGISIPDSCSWSKISEIYTILSLLSNEYDNLTYMFCPVSGGTDLNEICFPKEENCIMLSDYMICKPLKLIFEFSESLECSYFQLILNDLIPITEQKGAKEFIYIDSQGNYQVDQYENEKSVVRYLSGSFVIIRKTSILNKINGDLDGHFAIHEQKTLEEYKAFVLEVSKFYQSTVM